MWTPSRRPPPLWRTSWRRPRRLPPCASGSWSLPTPSGRTSSRSAVGWALPAATALAAAATVAAVAFGVWALTLNSRLSDEREPPTRARGWSRSSPKETGFPLEGANGSLVRRALGRSSARGHRPRCGSGGQDLRGVGYRGQAAEARRPLPRRRSSTVFELTRTCPRERSWPSRSSRRAASTQPKNEPLFATSRAA